MLRAVLAALALLAATPVPADEVAEARTRFEQGASLFRAGKYREAIAAFEAAYRLKPHGAIHFNVAQCREKLGEWPAALRSYQDYLRELPEARDRAAVRAAIGRLEQRLAGAGVQALLVYSDPPGAAVRLDGKARGRTPFHITLPSGAYRVALTLDGFAPEEQEVEVSLASSRLVEVVLRPQAGKVAATATPPATATMSSGVPLSAPPARAVPDLTPPPPVTSPLDGPRPAPVAPAPPAWGTRRVAAWASGVAALALVSAGVSYGLQARDVASQLKDGTRRSSLDADALARDARSKARTSTWLWGFGGAAAAASTTLFVLEGRF